MTAHRHRAKTSVERPYTGPVRPSRRNPMADGNVTRVETCSCGHRRLVNVNGRHREASEWSVWR